MVPILMESSEYSHWKLNLKKKKKKTKLGKDHENHNKASHFTNEAHKSENTW
jgi:hypothetical protein